jgi:fermentation-respiration switch protein FrsA (DUF1100 family)
VRNLNYEELSIMTDDGLKLQGWLMTAGTYEQKDTVVFMHENAGNIGLRLDYFQHLCHNMGVNVVSFAYRGYSGSEGTPSEHGLHLDALAMLKWCETTNKFDKERVFLLGRSLGGAVAISLLAEMEQKKNEFFKGAVIENTFSSISEMADNLFPFLSYIPAIK